MFFQQVELIAIFKGKLSFWDSFDMLLQHSEAWWQIHPSIMNFTGPEQFGNYSNFAVMLLIWYWELSWWITWYMERDSCVNLLFTKILILNFCFYWYFYCIAIFWLLCENQVHSLQTWKECWGSRLQCGG